MEYNVLRFKCADSGEAFFILFMRYSENHRFQIAAIRETGNDDNPNEKQIEVFNNTSKDIGRKNYDISQFDFTGWYCPYCGHREEDNLPDFVKCGKCRELICGTRVNVLPNGSKMFSCHDGCGETGALSGGGISSIEGVELRKNNSLPPPHKLLP